MSRVGMLPIPVPGSVRVDVSGRTVSVSGPKGTLDAELPGTIRAAVAGGMVTVARSNEESDSRARHGLVRNLLANMLTGVSVGFSRELLINGVGYRAEVQGENLVIYAGYSNPVEMAVPAGLAVEVDGGNRVVVTGIEKQRVGQFAAEIRSVRPPEPYKGKGIRYSDEHVRRKVGKSAIGTGADG